MKRTTLFLVLLLALAGTAALAASPSWPRFRGPNGDGVSLETGWNPAALEGGAKVLWKADIGVGYSSVVIQDGRLYTIGNSTKRNYRTTVSCLDAATGEVIWQQDFEDWGTGGRWAPFCPCCTPAIDGEWVYAVNGSGDLFCLSAADGKILWSKSLRQDYGAPKPDWGWAASPVIEGDLLLFNANTVQFAVDKLTGGVRWRHEDPPQPNMRNEGAYATPVVRDVGGIRCAFFVGAGAVSLIEVATGRKLWSWAIPYADVWVCVPDPVISESQAFLSMNLHSYLVDFGLDTPQPARQVEFLASALATPVSIDGFLYGSTASGEVLQIADLLKKPTSFQCVEFATGKGMWTIFMPYVSAVVASGKLIMLEIEGTLHIGEGTPSGYRDISVADVLAGAKRPRTFVTPPVLCDGRIYCRNLAGDLVCIDVSR